MPHQLDGLLIDPGDQASFERIAATLSAGPLPSDTDPPVDLWDRIAAAVAAERDAADPPTPDVTASGVTASGVTASGATVTSLDARRSTGGTRPPRFLMAVAAAVLVVVALGAVLFQRASDGGTELVASSDLALVAGDGTGRAELLRSGDQTVLRVDVSGLSPTEQSDFYELWLLDAGGGNPQPLSTFTEQDAVVEIELPAGLSTTEFPVVDISEEVDDGDVTHSGRSILRGELA